MAMINSALLNTLRTTFSKIFQNAVNEATPQYLKVATVVPSTSKSNTYGWLGKLPGFREWIGARQFKSIQEHGYTIVNKTFESSVEVDRDDIEDDNLGIYTPMVQSMADEGAEFPDELVFGLLGLGESELCYDGQNFFDTDHPVNSAHDGSGTDTSVSNIVTQDGYTGDAWYLLDTTKRIKPLLFQDRRKLKLTTLFNPDDPAVFNNNAFQFGADLRCNAGFGMWQQAIKVKGAATAANLWAAIERMESFTADGGKKMKLKPNMIVIPQGSPLKKDFVKLLNREQIDEGGTTVSNEFKDTDIELLVSSAL